MKTNLLHKYLANGMEICLSPNDFAPLVSLQIWVKAGSIDEEPGEEGIAHVLEHMLFKGTEKFPVSGQVASLVETAGGDINAYTTFDHTVYYLTGPSSFVMDGVDLLCDVVQNSLLDKDELERELEVIIEEIRQMRDNPMAMVSQSTFKALYGGTQLARPVIGYEEVVKGLTREKVRAYYKRWYSPNNMSFIAAGNFVTSDLLKKLEERAGEFQPLTVPRRTRPSVLALSAEPSEVQSRIQILSGPYQEARVNVSVRCPGIDDSKAAAWDMLSSILGGSDSSRLSRQVKDELGVVTSIDSIYYAPRYPSGIFGIVFYGEAETAHRALKAALSQLEILSRNGPTREEISRILSSVQASRIYARESVEGIARSLGQSLFSSRKLDFEEHYVEELKAVTAADVQKLAREVVCAIREKKYSLTVAVARELESLFSKENLESAVDEALGESSLTHMAAEHRMRSNTSAKNEDVKQIELDLPFGKKLRVNYRAAKRLPVVSSMLVMRNGVSFEHPDKNGVTSLLSEMLTRGTTRQSNKVFVDELDDRASSVGAFASRDLFGLRMDSLAENSLRTVQMMLDCFFRPALASDEWQRAKRETLEHLKAQKDRAGSRLSKLSAPLMFPQHSYSMQNAGSESTVETLQLEDVRSRWLKLFSSKEFVFSLAGDFDLDAVVDLLYKEFEQGLNAYADSASLGMPELFAPKVLHPNEPKFGFDELEREQAHISLLFRGVSLRDERRTSLELASQILGGQGGRLFMDLRDKRSLAYSLGASQSPHLLAGVFSTYIGTAAHKVEEALRGLKANLEMLASDLPSTQELERAQRSVLGVQSIDAQHHHYQAAQLAMSDIYGLGFDNFLSFEERVNKVTREDVRDVMADLMRNSPPVICIVGPHNVWYPEVSDSVFRWF